MRGFGVDASVPADVAAAIAVRAEAAGYSSFWVNGSPPEGALDIITQVSSATALEVGVGVFPLTGITASSIVTEIENRRIPAERLWLGIGSHRRPGALAEVRDAVGTLRTELGCRVVMAAVGPRMTALAGELADAVIFTWFIASDVAKARVRVTEGAAAAGRDTPIVASFIRCALLPQAAEAVRRRAEAYDAIPRYHALFVANGMEAADTIVSGASREEILPGIAREEAPVDLPIIRAIPAANTVDALDDLVRACAP